MRKKGMKVLSLFDGVSCARVAITRAGFSIEKYYASEIEKQPVEMAMWNYPDTVQLGDVKSVSADSLDVDLHVKHPIDLLIGGSPCQDLSIANTKRKGLKGERSGLFYEYLRLLKETRPRYFVLENVASMSKESRAVITKELGVEPIMIDAALVSGQIRKRLFGRTYRASCFLKTATSC